jgi:DUF3102 family protein
METAIAKTDDEQQVVRPLQVLVPLIKAELEAGEAAGIEHYRRAGEMLLEAKAQMPHGEWKPWLQRNFNRSYMTATNYMRLAMAHREVGEDKSKAGFTFATLSEFTQPHRTTHQPMWHEPVRQIVDRVDTETLNLRRDELKRVEERDAQRKLALQLIDIGYKVLARTLHPDKGGSKAAMTRLNAVRDRLKASAL